MRVTDKMIFERADRVTAVARERSERAASEAATGIRVEHPGDDPAAASRIVTHRLNERRFRALREAAETAVEELNIADGALAGFSDIVSRAQELATQMSNESYSATNRRDAATEIDGLRQAAISTLNARLGNRYLFSGLNDDDPAFDPSGAYQGLSQNRPVEVAPGQFENASVHGDAVALGVGVPGGVNILQSLADLSTALQANDQGSIEAQLGILDQGVGQVAAQRAQLGTSMNMLEIATSLAERTETTDKNAIANIAEVDMIQAATRLLHSQRALEAALSVSARTFELTLINKLR